MAGVVVWGAWAGGGAPIGRRGGTKQLGKGLGGMGGGASSYARVGCEGVRASKGRVHRMHQPRYKENFVCAQSTNWPTLHKRINHTRCPICFHIYNVMATTPRGYHQVSIHPHALAQNPVWNIRPLPLAHRPNPDKHRVTPKHPSVWSHHIDTTV